MKIGDKVIVKPAYDGCNGQPVEAKVVYIHPERRYYIAEFIGPAPNFLRFRETFPYQYRRGNDA